MVKNESSNLRLSSFFRFFDANLEVQVSGPVLHARIESGGLVGQRINRCHLFVAQGCRGGDHAKRIRLKQIQVNTLVVNATLHHKYNIRGENIVI